MSSTRIGYPHELRSLHLPHVKCFSVKWSSRYTYALSSTGIIERPHHPLYGKVLRQWSSRNDPLWWNIVTSIKNGSTHKTVRGWMSRRGSTALQEALANNGYHKNGRKQANDNGNVSKALTSSRVEAQPASDLCGNLHIFMQHPALKISWDDLVGEADVIVKALEKKQMFPGKRRSPNRSRGIGPKSPVP